MRSLGYHCTSRADGDFVDPARFEPGTTWLEQVHGATVVTVTSPGQHAGVEADAAVTAVSGCVLAVRTADCVPLVLHGLDNEAVGVVHAGWRGLAAGVVEAAAHAMRALGVEPVAARLGPHIRRGCYEFGRSDLDEVTRRLGAEVEATTLWGAPALDLTAATRSALWRAGVERILDEGSCTACTDTWYSFRAGGEPARFATMAGLDSSSMTGAP
ncbi:MAG: polyphenol oxidase family protein [Acidimicrobiales bacterium]